MLIFVMTLQPNRHLLELSASNLRRMKSHPVKLYFKFYMNSTESHKGTLCGTEDLQMGFCQPVLRYTFSTLGRVKVKTMASIIQQMSTLCVPVCVCVCVTVCGTLSSSSISEIFLSRALLSCRSHEGGLTQDSETISRKHTLAQALHTA